MKLVTRYGAVPETSPVATRLPVVCMRDASLSNQSHSEEIKEKAITPSV